MHQLKEVVQNYASCKYNDPYLGMLSIGDKLVTTFKL